jgi:hypothetical protein
MWSPDGFHSLSAFPKGEYYKSTFLPMLLFSICKQIFGQAPANHKHDDKSYGIKLFVVLHMVNLQKALAVS